MFDVVTELARQDDVSCMLLFADDLVMMNETSDRLSNKSTLLEAFGSEGLKVNLEKTKATVSGSIT